MKIFGIIMIVLVALLGGTYVLATSGVSSQEGYADITLPDIPELNKKFSIDVGPLGVLPVKWALGFAEEKELELLKNVDGIKVKIYEMNGDIHSVYNEVSRSFAELKSSGWETIVSVKEDHERVAIFTRIQGETIKGVYVFVVNESEAIFVNVMGTLTPEDIVAVTAYRP